MKKFIFLLILFIFLGVGCRQEGAVVLNSENILPTLKKTAKSLSWPSNDVITKSPSKENNYGKVYILNGPSRENKDRLSVDISSLEIFEYNSNESAEWNFSNDECFKGRGIPITVEGVSACCLNDANDGQNSVIMLSGHYLLRVIDYFHSSCYAKKYLEEFWKNYRN